MATPVVGAGHGGFNVYPEIDDPAQAPAFTSVPNKQGGIAGRYSASGVDNAQANTEYALFTFTLGSGLPATGIRVGVLTGIENASSLPSTIRVAGGGGDSGSIAVAQVTNQVDGYFFDILGGAFGETYTVFGNTGNDTLAFLSGLTFDAVPVPDRPLSA